MRLRAKYSGFRGLEFQVSGVEGLGLSFPDYL